MRREKSAFRYWLDGDDISTGKGDVCSRPGAISGRIAYKEEFLTIPRHHVPQVIRVLHAAVMRVHASLYPHHYSGACGDVLR